MNTMYFISTSIAFCIAMMIMPAMRNVAFKVSLLDKPNHRKIHHSQVPLVGGISIFVAWSLSLLFVIPVEVISLANKTIYFSGLLLLLVGVLDDRFDIKPTIKLLIQLLLAHFAFYQGIRIESLFGFLGIYEINELAQYFLTVLVISGVTNAFNLMDGIDGLAAGLTIVGFAVYALLSYHLDLKLLLIANVTWIGATIAFLRYNLSKNQKVFMGDAGSLVTGYFMAIFGIQLINVSNNTPNVSITVIGVVSVLIIPVIDALRVFRKRVKSGKKPWAADKTHLHHLILALGAKREYAFMYVIVMFLGINMMAYSIFHFFGLNVAIIGAISFFVIIESLLQFGDKIRTWKKRLKGIEQF